MMSNSFNVARDAILRKYNLTAADLLGRGMEAEVYPCEADKVLKLYPGTTNFDDLLTLQTFYASLDEQLVPYALPLIYSVASHESFLVTIERQLDGIPMSAVLVSCTAAQQDTLMERYLTAALALGQLRPPPEFTRYKLFDPHYLSERTAGDWHHFLANYLAHKLPQVTPYLGRDVIEFEAKVARLYEIFKRPYEGNYHLIHGDLFPGNLLIDESHHVTAMLDFGMLTMYGDPLFDIATSWVFFDMYDELQAQLRERYLAVVINRLGERVRGKLYRYVLFYSIIGANMFSSTCSDGQYQWCVANLNTPHYWDVVT